MNYKQMIEQARANGMATEKKMWAAVETLSTDLLALEQTDISSTGTYCAVSTPFSTAGTIRRRWPTTM